MTYTHAISRSDRVSLLPTWPVVAMSATVAMVAMVTMFGAACMAKDMAKNETAASMPEMAADLAESGEADYREISGKDDEGDDSKQKAGGKGKGQGKSWKRSTLEANTSRLMIGDREELPIRGMQMHVRIDGFRARVLIDFFFENPHPQQYEGTFKLRPPTGASPYFLAFGQSVPETAETPVLAEGPAPKPAPANQLVMAIAMDDSETVRARGFEPSQVMVARAPRWQAPKEARMVPREQAAMAYQSTVRRRVDPALMEWAGAGVFNARIFPIAPNRLHRVVVGYDMDLTRLGADLELSLPVPKDIATTAVDIDVAALDGVSMAVTPSTKGARDGARTYYRFDNVSGQEISLRLQGVPVIALVGEDGEGGQTGQYFAASVAPDVPEQAKPKGAGGAGGAGHAVFLVDTSLSANPDRFVIWLALMRAILERNRGTGIEQFAVAFFNVETHWWQSRFVANTPENVSALMDFANGLALEGATDLGAGLRQAARPAWLGAANAPREVFLLSDGAVTWGESDAFALSNILRSGGVTALYTYRTGMTGDDAAMLGHLARESGGAVFSVAGESEVASAAVAHTRRPWRIENMRMDGARDLLIAGRPLVLFPGQRILVVGRGAPKGPLSLELSQGSTRRTVTVAMAHQVASPLAARAYGQIAVGQLEEFLGFTDSFAEAYARHFRVTGKTTSLLMLESEEDYRRFGIRPQNDAGVIKASFAAELVAKAMAELAQVLGDAKYGFLERSLRGHKLSDQLRALLAALPGRVFQVDVPPLATEHRGKQGISTALLQQLATRKPEYDTISADAERRTRTYGAADGLKSLSSLVEANPGDGVLARDIGYTAMQWGLHAHAYYLFQRVATARPFEPQTFRAMAQTLAEMGKTDLALAYFEIALQGEWDARFGEFRRIVVIDYIRFLRRSGGSLQPSMAAYASRRADELERDVGIGNPDLLVTITWNTDNTDVDLHVIEPSGEECFYSHNRTASGGELTQDVTQGYGPEMYVLRKAPRGTYHIRAKYFSSDANRASARTKVYVSVYRKWGTAEESVQNKVVTLAYGKDMHEVFELVVK